MTTTLDNQGVQPYLFFDGRCDEAIEFYKRTLGAEVEMVMRFKECPAQDQVPPGSQEKVMHGSLLIRGSRVMLSDGNCAGKANFQGFSLSLTAKDPDDAARLFKGLSEGGKVQMPLGKTFFSPSFGTVTDRFGVGWMVIVAA